MLCGAGGCVPGRRADLELTEEARVATASERPGALLQSHLHPNPIPSSGAALRRDFGQPTCDYFAAGENKPSQDQTRTHVGSTCSIAAWIGFVGDEDI